MKIKWFLAIVGVLLLALAVVLALAEDEARRSATATAGLRLEIARKAASAALVRAVADARGKLAAWKPGDPAPEGLRSVAAEWGAVELEDRIDGTPVTFHPAGQMDVFVEQSAPGEPATRRRGRITAGALRTAIESAHGVGPAGPHWTRIAIVDRRGSTLLVLPDPRPETQDEPFVPGPEWERMRGCGALAKIAQGRPGELDVPGGHPPRYKTVGEKAALGVWARIDGDSDLLVLVEVEEEPVLADLSGWRVHWRGRTFATVRLWYVVLAFGLLSLLVALFLVVAGRYAEIGPLARVYGFAKPYAMGIAGAVIAGASFSAAKTLQTLLIKQVADDVLVRPGPDAQQTLFWIVLQTIGLGLVMAVTTFFKDFLQNYYSTAMVNDIRLSIGRRLVQLPMSFFHRMRTGDLNARIERDVAGLRILLNEVFEQGFVKPFQLVGALVAAFVMNWQLACFLLGMPIIVVPLFRIARKIRKRAEKRQVLIADISHVLFQILTGIKIVKAFGGEDREVDRLAEANAKYIRQVRKIQRLAALSKGLMDLLQMAGGAALIWFGGRYVLDGAVSLGDLMAFMLVVQLVYDAAKELTGTSNKVIEQTPAVLRVFEVLDAQDTLTDGPEELPKRPLTTGIELRGVRFRYLDTDVLRGVDLTVPAGKVVALVGPTGAGKTTICDLVARLYDATAGEVLLDGRDVRRFTKASLLRSVAVVTQDAFLFNTTIEENIRYGREDATREEVEAAARDAFVHDDILAMDGGYSKLCGERGTALSGGQRQRVTIARAILKDAPILILDEATSNLDSHSESQVQAALAKLMSGRTVIVVAHRLSTIRNADLVVVLEAGAIVEKGTPAALLERPHGRFRAMYDLQMGERGGDPGDAPSPV